MAKIQSKKRTGNGGDGPLCPYCRDSVSEGAIVECDQCQTRYHRECVTSCVILGCVGCLVEKTAAKIGSPIELGAPGLAHGAKLTSVKVSENTSSGSCVLYAFLGVVPFGCTLLAMVVSDPNEMDSLILIGMLVGLLFFFTLVLVAASSSSQAATRAKAKKDPSQENSSLKKSLPASPKAEDGTENPGGEKPGPGNFYAKGNIAPPQDST